MFTIAQLKNKQTPHSPKWYVLLVTTQITYEVFQYFENRYQARVVLVEGI